jgi:hypothetical protein
VTTVDTRIVGMEIKLNDEPAVLGALADAVHGTWVLYGHRAFRAPCPLPRSRCAESKRVWKRQRR